MINPVEGRIISSFYRAAISSLCIRELGEVNLNASHAGTQFVLNACCPCSC